MQATPQERIASLHREIILDVLCRLGNGKLMNIEIQKGDKNDDIRRCRFHLSSITANKTPKGTDFKNIPNVTIIYITEYDALGNGKTITCSEMCQKIDDVYYPLNDGAKVYYANTVIKDNTEKSELLDLFLQKDCFENEKFPHLSQAMKYYKKDSKGVSQMCTIVEEYAKEYAEEQTKEQMRNVAKTLISMGMSNEDIATATHLSEDVIENLRIAQ